VSTPQLPEEKEEDPRLKQAPPGETPEQAFARKQEELAEQEAHEPESFLAQEVHLDSHDLSESRLSIKQRFPSRDIWEDSPDSLQLQTTVSEPKGEEDKDAAAPTSAASVVSPTSPTVGAAAKPLIPARPTKPKSPEAHERAQPVVPSRPSEKQVDGHSPTLPTKSKPQVPARPSKPLARNSSENVLTKVPSDASAKSTGSDQGVASKPPKPPVPSRPVGSKIAALQSGFMLDLNKRLQLGPHAPKKEEPAPGAVEEEKEKAPLADARKGRARGPARRAPAKSPAPAAAAATAQKPTATCGLHAPSTLWQIDPEDDLLVSHQETAEPAATAPEVTAPTTKAVEPVIEAASSSKPEHEAHVPSEPAPAAEPLATEDSVAEEAHTAHPAEAIQEETAKEESPAKAGVDAPAQVEATKEAPVAAEEIVKPEAADKTSTTSADPVKPDAEEVAE
jgi:hypothetical protein